MVIRLRDYQRLSEASRKETLHGIWARVQRETGGREPVSVPAPQVPARPADPVEQTRSRPEPPAAAVTAEPEADLEAEEIPDEEAVEQPEATPSAPPPAAPLKTRRGVRPVSPLGET